jgi:RNA-binding protein
MPAIMALLPHAAIKIQNPIPNSSSAPSSTIIFARSRPLHVHRRNLTLVAGMQQPLSSAEKKAKRSESQRLGKAIVLTQLGQKGITPAFIESTASALVANEFIKVRVGGDEEIKEVAETLEKEIDCIVVHKIGFVLTLYRDKSLPPPACLGGPKDEAEAAEIAAEAKNKKKAKRKQPSAPEGPPPPPEFTIL